MKKIPALLFACIMLSALCMEIQVSAQGCGIHETHISSDWNITSNISRHDETIILSGNLTIAPNGNLTLVNTILKLDCASDGEYGIEVKSGGAFHAYNSRIETTTEDWNKDRFWFYVSENTDFQLEDSYIRKCGIPYMGTDYDGLTVKTENASVRNCTFTENNKGIVFSNTKNASVSNCIFQSNKYWAVHIYNCSNINIEDSAVLSTGGTGIKVEYSNEISIKHTRVIAGSFVGISLSFSNYNTILNSNISGNGRTGILIENSDYNLVKKCVISDHIYENPRTGLYAEKSNSNEFCNNDFNGNTYNAWDNGNNNWTGNYWDDYTGVDVDDNGLGDTPYNISGGPNQDCYPLTGSWEALKARAPIYIDGNAQFTIEEGVMSGSGTESDPYVIEYWNINASSVAGIETHGIHIRNTDAYFIIRNCIARDGISKYAHGIYFFNVTHGMIENVSSYNNSCGICLHYCCSENTILNCDIHTNRRGVLLTVSASNNTIRNCKLYNNSDGIYFEEAHNNTIENCVIYESDNDGIRFGIYNASWEEYFSSRNNIRNCVIYENSHGVYLSCCSLRNNLANCTIYNNSYGIYMLDSSNNTISYCNLYNNSVGIELWYSLNNQITYCSITNNTNYGVYISYRANYSHIGNNIFHHNNFINNAQNAYDICINFWDDGYPSGGNYWSDYTGDDLYSGINQNELSSDSIGDTPYNISGGTNKDRYPLMSPTFILETTWEIANETCIANETKILDKNLVVKSAGKLTLCNATLIVNCTYNGEYQIEVYGKMSILNGSNITSANPDWHYLLSVRKNAIFKMQNSSLSYSGWDNYNSGLIIEANNSCIENSVFSNNYCGIVFNSSGNALVSNCTFSNNLYGISGYLSHNSIFKNCSLLQNYVGISLYHSENSLISECKIANSSYQGIILDHSEGSTIENCDVYNNFYGIYLGSSSNDNIINCTIYNNSDNGIWLFYSLNNTITNCSVYNNYYGIRLSSSSNNNQITNCNVTGNYYGLYFTKSRNITIRYTEISARRYGMYFFECSRIILSDSSISGSNESIYSYKSNFEIENITGKDILVGRTCANITSASFTRITYLDEYNCINVSWHLKIRVVIDSTPAKSASVTIYDAQDKKILEAETDENGEIECNITEYTARGVAQKINYTPHKIVVVKNEFTKTCSVVMCKDNEIVIKLEEIREEVKFISSEMLGLFAVVFGVIIMTLVLEYMSRRRYRRKRKL